MLGGSGFVGTQLCAALVRAGWIVTVPTRDPERAKHLKLLPALALVAADVHHLEKLAALCAGQQAVVNLVGILNERGRDGRGFDQAHAALARKLVAACRRQRVPRLLQMSALNADADRGVSNYQRSKGQAERIVREECGTDIGWTIFRPSVIFGPRDAFVNRFSGLLRTIPFVFPLARPGARFQPVWVEDVVAAIMKALADDATAGECYELGGPEVFTLREIVTMARDRLGLRRLILGMPDFASRIQAAIFDFVPGKPFSTDNYRSLLQDSVVRSDGFARLGIRPQPLGAVFPHYAG